MIAQVIQIIPEADLLWVITASALVFLMQAGFLALEAGLTRSKNAINVAIKNMADFGMSTVLFWLIGFAIMFGATAGGWIGTEGFAPSFDEAFAWPTVFFTFQVMFAGTAVTILSGAVAERVRFGGYLFLAVLVAGFTYPIFGHWAWNGLDVGDVTGWLAKLGFVDFAGSTVVHSVGGWTSLAVLLVIGPRLGRFPKDGPPQKIQGNNLPFATMGALLLFVGWLGFNGGSTLGIGANVGRVIANTVLAGSFGLVAAMLLGYRLKGRAEIDHVINGALGGLVAITAGAHAMDSSATAIVGAVGGLVAIGASELLEKLRIDDAVGAVPVHLGAGIWGTLAVGIFGEFDLLGTGLGRWQQIGVQGLGIVVCGLSTFGVTYFVVRTINRRKPFRVSEEDERVGLNVSEHGASTELLDFFTVMDRQARSGDLSLRAPVEPFTEVGQIAGRYNQLMNSLEESEAKVMEYQQHLEQLVDTRTAQLELALEQLESTDTVIIRWKLDGTIIGVNRFGLNTLGYESDEIVGGLTQELLMPASDEATREWSTIVSQLIEHPDRGLDMELETRTKSGSSIWVDWRNRPILDDDNRIAEVISIGIDTTERRELEAELQAAKDRMQEELDIGRDIQMSMLPLQFPAFPDRTEFSIYAALEPALEVGGDFYDLFLVDHDHLCFSVGDVSDKGVPAALFMAVTKTLIKAQAVNGLSPAGIMAHVNEELNINNEMSMFVTIFLCIINVRTGELVFTNAGHNPPYVKKGDGSLLHLTERHGPVVGAVEGISYGESRLTLDPGDAVILYTDGVTEAMNPEKDLFSDEALETLIAESKFSSTEAAVAAVFDSVREHRREADPSDDITVLALSFDAMLEIEGQLLEITVPSEIEAISTIFDEFASFAEEHSLSDPVRRAVLLVLDEFVNNIVSYSHSHTEEHEIKVVLALSTDRLAVTIEDDGEPFDPFKKDPPDLDASIDNRQIGGLGIHLVKSVMDDYEYKRLNERNMVTVYKNLDPGPEDDNK